MTKNTLVASVEFYFKGERYAPSVRIDLDRIMETLGNVPSLHSVIAREGGIDPYSYQYEVLEMEPIRFSEVEGFAGEFIHDGELDADGFAAEWRKRKVMAGLGAIAQRRLDVAELAQQPALAQALWEAYLLGRDSREA